MVRPLILTRRAPSPDPARASRPALPEHHFDAVLGLNVTADGVPLVHAGKQAALAEYTGTQEAGRWKKDD
ncbi:hypothetical protein ACFZBU_17950 [Embleya sp. NPDC008237]|uniref:hypothetical protein n=1 Tax=Embleya sp. NPDC008237 TaxID=3363978 RepID=UPI0036E0EC2B